MKVSMKRRELIKSLGAGFCLFNLPLVNAAQAFGKSSPQKKVVWLMLRGAMDSLHAIVPTFDQHLMSHRGDLVSPILDKLKPLGSGFGLHPDLAFMHELYLRKQLSPIVAVATPYRARSHFAAQDVLESGQPQIDHDSGWLARAIAQHSGAVPQEGLAIARSMPISLRGGAARTWYPSNLPESGGDTIARLMGLYERDSRLSARLQEAIDTQDKAGEVTTARRPKLPELARACARLLKGPGATGAMLEMGGWDTHSNQVGRLSRQFKMLDQTLKSLHDELSDQWQHTLVIVATEFGRTVAVNGTRGTDHGTGSVMWLAGGSIDGGKVLGQWPGLAKEQLYQGRDLAPTSNSFDWMSQALQAHWGLSESQLRSVFPV